MLTRVDTPTPEELYEKHSARLYRYCYRLSGGNEAEAEDLASETLVSAICSLDQFEGRSTVVHWLFTIALHAWQKRLRRRTDLLDEETPGADPIAPVIDQIAIREAMARLSEN